MTNEWQFLAWRIIAYYLILVGVAFIFRPIMGEKNWKKIKKHASNSFVFVALLPFRVVFWFIELFFRSLWEIIRYFGRWIRNLIR
ncbi:TPA: hypothetical protein DF272_05775 [Candidatus Falkowbacteria bacterium]|nr:hypothetical protein [Candidatus Falkowbacteria bacterium]